LPRAGGGGNNRPYKMDTEAQIRKMKTFWRWMVVMVAQQCECTLIPLTCLLKMVKWLNFMLCVFHYNWGIQWNREQMGETPNPELKGRGL
jgi:hypothetical protein